MTRQTSNTITLVFSTAGAILSGWLTVEHFLPQVSLPCGSDVGGCESVLQSSLSHIGPIPTALFGCGLYVLIAWACALRKRLLKPEDGLDPLAGQPESYGGTVPDGVDGAHPTAEQDASSPPEAAAEPAPSPDLSVEPEDLVRGVDRMIWALALAGFCVSLFLQYNVLIVLQSFCPWCFTSAVLLTIIFLLASRDFLLKGEPLTEGQQTMLAALALLVGILIFTLYGHVKERIRMTGTIVNPDIAAHDNRKVDVKRDLLVKKDLHIHGSPTAPYLLIEFGDYQCPNCRRGSAVAADLVDQSGGRVKLAFRNFPLVMHTWARPAAYAAEAAGLQGKFWEMHDKLYQKQDLYRENSSSPPRLNDWAGSLGLNVSRFVKDSASPKVKSRVDADVADGTAVRVHSTPTFFVVTPENGIYQFTAVETLETAMKNPNHPMWAK